MNLDQALAPADTAVPLSDLVNPHGIRSAVRRLFTGGLDEILGELLQNSQRAGARQVDITRTPTGWTYTDDGHGVAGVAGFHTLLRLADSHFANPQVAADQQPMGLGLHALLAHEGITAMTFRSGGLRLIVDTARWWADPAYYTRWADRLAVDLEPPPGLHIEVACTPAVAEAVGRALQPDYDRTSPAQGYADLLAIRLDGQPVETGDPRWMAMEQELITGTYAGCPIRIGFGRRHPSRHAGNSAVNWFGQIIPVATPFQGQFFYHLTVRSGHPVTPRAPSRLGLVENAQLRALHEWVVGQIFAWLAAQPQAALRPEWVEAAYAVDPARAAVLPWFVAAPWRTDPAYDSFEDVQNTGPAEVCTYAAPPLLVESDLQVIGPPAAGEAPAEAGEPWTYGHESLLPLLGRPAYRLRAGATERLALGRLWWQPGLSDGDIFYAPGVWGLGTADTPPAAWQPVPAARTVWAFQETAAWSVEDVEEWLVATPDKLAFYANEAWAGFDWERSDDNDYDTLRDSYEESCAAARRALVGAAVPYRWTLQDLALALPRGSGRILAVTCEYEPPEAPNPAAVRVATETGGEHRFRLLD